MVRAFLGGIVGAAACAAALLLLTTLRPGITLEMDLELPGVASGLYPPERHQDETFAWTRPSATFRFSGLDRSAEWSCRLRLRGARPGGVAPAEVTVAVDGIRASTRTVGNEYEEIEVPVPPSAASSLALTIGAAQPYVPPSDPRELGVQLDRLACSPVSGARVMPPMGAMVRATASGAAFGALFGLAASGLSVTVLAALIFAAALAWVLNTGVAAYTRPFLEWILPAALWIVAPLGAILVWRHGRVSGAARFVLAFSGSILFLKILTLLHPGKVAVDALFHAHRFEWVLDGRYFFTQPMPGGVQFPYAIGLYVSAIPFATLIPDYVSLLRIVVCVVEAGAAALLYVVVYRVWKDRFAAAWAVVFCHLAPLPYVVIGNANLTYAFGQSISVVAVAVASLLTFRFRNPVALAALFSVTALAFLSHVGIFPLLAVTLVTAGGLYRLLGRGDIRASGAGIAAVTVLAAIVAFGSYYAHFPEVYRTLDRVSAQRTPPGPGAAQPGARPLPPTERATRAVTLGIRALHWPLIALAAVGLVSVVRSPRDRLTLTLAAWGISFIVFVAFRIVAPVDPALQRYADEFTDRVYYATIPAVAILAARGVSAGWRSAAPWRVSVGLIGAAAVVIGIDSWTSWIR